MQETGRRSLSKTLPAFSQIGVAALGRRVFAPSEILHAGLHERGGHVGAGAIVMVLVVSTLFPKFLSPSCLSEGRAPSPLPPVSREEPSALPKGRAKGAQALPLLLHPQDDTQQRRISCSRVQEQEEMLQEEGEAMPGTAFCRAVAWHEHHRLVLPSTPLHYFFACLQGLPCCSSRWLSSEREEQMLTLNPKGRDTLGITG